jgi:hypothetical protein
VVEIFFASHHWLQILIIAIGYLMPIPLAMLAIFLWHEYRQDRFIFGVKWVLLEIQVPRDVVKSPATMELIFSSVFYQQSKKGFWERFIMGAPWLWFSCEIASIDGRVHFYIRTPSRLRSLLETQIYGQFSQAKVVEVEDYTMKIPQYKKDGNWNVWGCEFTKQKEDFRPIKTYKNFGDDMKSGIKEEFKVDPITPVIEYLGSLSKGQQVWIQIIVRQSIKQYKSKKDDKHINFNDASVEYMEEILAPYTRTQKNDNIPGTFGKQVGLPKHLEPLMKAIGDNLNTLHFDCGIRVMALADKKYHSVDAFNNIRRDVRLLFRQYALPYSNEFLRVNSTLFDAPWSDPTGLALTKIKKRTLDYYRGRTFFHAPLQYSRKFPFPIDIFFPSHYPRIFVLSTEELATIFHFPGMVSETPSFKRIESKIAKPPSNLPI